MPSKTTKKARRAGAKKGHKPEQAVKDDGKLYKVVDATGRNIYPGQGVKLGEAERLAKGLKFVGAVVPID
jgi:hypothetical protein